MPRPFLDIIVTDVSDRASYLADLFCTKASRKYGCPEHKAEDLEVVLDDLHGLVHEFDYQLDARKAVGAGLQVCWNNLPPERPAAIRAKQTIIDIAVDVGAQLKSELSR